MEIKKNFFAQTFFYGYVKKREKYIGRLSTYPFSYRESFLEKLLDLVKHETARSADPHKLMAAADV